MAKMAATITSQTVIGYSRRTASGSAAAVGVVAGIVAIPAGVYLHHAVLPAMAHAANSGVPPSLLSVYAPWDIVLLALAGPAIAIAGALGPAGWAALTRTAVALRAE
jgi:putative ABC transport system permease protein